MEYEVKTDRYTGPYTKLLSMIEERKLSITELALGSIAESYVEHVRGLQEKNLGDMSQFVVVAATLPNKLETLVPVVPPKLIK